MPIKLRLPLKDIFVTQPFGVNYLDFYKKMGLPHHPGVDFRTRNGCPFYYANSGTIKRCGTYSDGGLGVEVESAFGYSTFYYHLKEFNGKVGDKVAEGQYGGLCDNTGKYTTGDHLHFELRINGEKVDPAPYFAYNYLGQEISNKDWDKSRCYHRYYRGRPKGGLFNEIKILAILGKKGIWATPEKINALVYGGWDLESVVNPAMYEITSQLKKSEYLEGEKSFS